jgi:epoxyqueuosine reductase
LRSPATTQALEAPSAARVKELGRQAGFDLVRIGNASDLHSERMRYLEWIEGGRQGDMRWIGADWVGRSTSPCSSLPAAKSVISVALSYGSSFRPRTTGNVGRIARYAWGSDYHEVLGGRLRDFSDRLCSEFGGEHRWYVDTGPQMDKALAARAGLGWYGKNTNVLTESFGSFVLLGEIITSLELAIDAALEKNCGSCRLCLIACPTGALGPEYSIDSRKCISYLTIEHRGPIPRELRPLMGNWVFGCDICQDVCPPSMSPFLEDAATRRDWLRQVRKLVKGEPLDELHATEASSRGVQQNAFYSGDPRSSLDLFWLLSLSHEDYVAAFRGTSIKRAKAWMLRRNAAIALGNVGDQSAVDRLALSMRGDDTAVVRGHAAWGLGRIGERGISEAVRKPLERAVEDEDEEEVRGEILLALEMCPPRA